MAISLNGTNQYVSLGTATDIYRTRPLSVAALIDTSAWVDATAYGFIAEGNDNTGTGAGWHLYRETDNKCRYEWWTAASTARSAIVSTTTLANTGWHLVVGAHKQTGANSDAWCFDYAYKTETLNSGTINSSQGQPSAPGGSDVTMIGALQKTSITNYFAGAIGWVAVFSVDVTNAGSTTAPMLWELITRGPWGMLDSNCKLFIPFSNADKDLSASPFTATLVNSPSYVGSGPTEVFPLSVIAVTRQPAASSSYVPPNPLANLRPNNLGGF